MKTKKLILKCFLIACVMASANGLAAQEVVLFTYNFKTNPIDLTAQGVVHTGLIISDFTVNGEGLTIAGTLGTNYGHKGFVANSFSTTNSQYYEFTISTVNGLTVDLSKFSITYKRAAAGSPENIKMVLSKDNFVTAPVEIYSNIGITNTTQIKLTDIALASQITIGPNETATIRLIPWNTVATGTGGVLLVNLSFSGSLSAPLKEAPVSHVTNFTAVLDSPSYNSIKLTWVDSDADNYLIKTTSSIPVNGVAESDTVSLVRNVKKGDQSFIFTPICEGTTYTFKIYPYNNWGENTLYKTVDAPTASATTELEDNVNPMICADGLTEVSGATDVWVKGYIRGFVRTSLPYTVYVDYEKSSVDTITSGFNMSLLLADSPTETQISKMFYVKLSDPYIRSVLNLKFYDENLGRYLAVKGKIGNNTIGEANYYGFTQVFSYRWLDQTSKPKVFDDRNISVISKDGVITVKGITEPSVIKIFNLQGVQVKELFAVDNLVEITQMLSGTYIVSVKNSNSETNRKITL